MSEQPNTSDTFRPPHNEVEQPARYETQQSHLERIQFATQMVISKRKTYLDRIPNINLARQASPFWKLFMGEESYNPRDEAQREFMIQESQIGGRILGETRNGIERKFYCSQYEDRPTWLWHEESIDPTSGKSVEIIVRYNTADQGILKTHGKNSHYINNDELENLTNTIEEYVYQVCARLYPSSQDDYTLAN